MTKKISDEARAIIAPFVPEALKNAVEKHKFFTNYKPLMDAKRFKEYQDACKASMAHITMTLKLAAMVGPSGTDDQESIKTLLAAAQKEVAEYAKTTDA